MVSILKKILGSKSQRDIKVLEPFVDKALGYWEEFRKLSHDELRAKTDEFRERIRNHIAAKEKEIEDLKTQINAEETEIEEKEKLYGVLDRLEKESYELTQEILTEILPEAFAVMKDTARRFFENEVVEVTATQFDRDLAAKKANVEIHGDRAHYRNS
ncbi:MAG TPA: hypothetical protein VMC08_09210, partial [Bacteroidales bacterium]|nr:hypothetical protein [Bacteroidales bacterium]